jgi:hypothetical protein
MSIASKSQSIPYVLSQSHSSLYKRMIILTWQVFSPCVPCFHVCSNEVTVLQYMYDIYVNHQNSQCTQRDTSSHEIPDRHLRIRSSTLHPYMLVLYTQVHLYITVEFKHEFTCTVSQTMTLFRVRVGVRRFDVNSYFFGLVLQYATYIHVN